MDFDRAHRPYILLRDRNATLHDKVCVSCQQELHKFVKWERDYPSTLDPDLLQNRNELLETVMTDGSEKLVADYIIDNFT